MGLLDWLRPSGAGTEPDGFPLRADHELAVEHRLISGLMRELAHGNAVYQTALRSTEHGRQIGELPVIGQRRMVLAAFERSFWGDDHPRQITGLADVRWWIRWVPMEVLKALLRRRLPLTTADLTGILGRLRKAEHVRVLHYPLLSLLKQVEWYGGAATLPTVVRDALVALRDHLRSGPYDSADRRAVLRRIEELTATGPALAVTLDPGERWVDEVMASLAAMPSVERARWSELALHLLGATSPKPSARWLKEALRLRERVGPDAFAFRTRAEAWIAAAAEPAPTAVQPRNGDFLRGLIWLLADQADDDLARIFGDLALAMGRKLPNIGMRSVKVLNACVATLGTLPGTEPLAQLTRLRAKLKAPKAQALIATTLEAAARRQGMPLADLEELVVPTFGMEEVGCLREVLGDYTAEVRVTGTDSVALTWVRADGRAQKGVPAEVQRAHGEELKELKRTASDMAKMLEAQRDRLEQLLLADRSLPLPAWRERYLDHPLVGPLARRLIWHFEEGDRTGTGAWLDGEIVSADDEPLVWPSPSTGVRLWHPIGFPVDAVRAWRLWLERHERSQPFKQAHREIYVITDAELATATYSNRFAAHILKQHQFAALAKARGWRYQLQGWFDSQSTPTLDLPRWGLRAEFWVEPCVGDDQTMSESGVALYASTDQLRFVNEAGVPVPVSEVPALVFSEVMRDADLFTGVASVGADPTWMDRGEHPAWNGYWHSYSFGDLSASAETRRDVLSRLLPRLKIADRCAIDGKFLVVRGDVRTYKIHLGSGNILMEPNGQYLCIVPDRSAGARESGRVWLPFEGDGTMAVILSKAFLLAADTSITDPTIVRQIRPG